MPHKWGNAVQRRNHKERAQPLERQKWGLLEKRKDYKLRAADHKEKKKRLKVLKQKAADRNPDEFSYKMMSSTVDSKGRKVADRGNKALSMDVVKLLKTQDAGYIRTMLQMVRKEREELEQKIVVDEDEARALKDGDYGKTAKRTVYVGDKAEQEEFNADSCHATKKSEAVDEEQLSRPRKLTKKQREAQIQAEKEKASLMKKRERALERAAAHLEALKARERDLVAAEEELEQQRAKMNNTVGGVNKHGVKFKIRERKR
ncbi:U3 small nucleolar RNA-associated protein 11 [Corynespora cassiicola Philippines]|uniref:U3 small nucleolar RNA-associated protein 11 n=1 Tax=Corynespora cassiicola Philippines TaxID=1448308 RepID=A0A2T2NNX6_CORCC|nr:U3 small nucleolar RNA-associated protein 11 [Corynespora cassiicola Philippines]